MRASLIARDEAQEIYTKSQNKAAAKQFFRNSIFVALAMRRLWRLVPLRYSLDKFVFPSRCLTGRVRHLEK